MRTIPTSPSRKAFEAWLRNTFKVRALDLLRDPADHERFADKGLQLAWQSWEAGIAEADRILQGANEVTRFR